jgi:voltage-gated potassium channel
MTTGVRAFRSDRGYERWTRHTDGPLLALAVVFVVVLVLPFARDLSPLEARVVSIANVLIWAVFAVDYCVRFYLASRRWQFV